MLHLKFHCLKHNVCLCCSYFLHPLWGRMFGHHTPTHIARLFTLISGLLLHLPFSFYYYSRFLPFPSFLPTHSTQPPTEMLSSTLRYVFKISTFLHFPSEMLLHAFFLLRDHLLPLPLQSFSNLYLALQRFRLFSVLPLPFS